MDKLYNGDRNIEKYINKSVWELNMNIEFLKDIALGVGGKNAAFIVEQIVGRKNVNEFLIAKKLGLTINQTRNLLYKLADEGLVSSTRKKDKKKGWYTYFWTFNEDKALILLQRELHKAIERLERDIESRKTKRFYYSPGADTEYTEEKALDYNFICPETGELMELKDNTSAIKQMEVELSKLREKLKEVNSELGIVENKKAKSIDRRIKREAKKKSAERKSKRAAKKSMNESAKKTIKKKPVKKKSSKKKSVKKKPVKKKSAKKVKKSIKKSSKKKSSKKRR